MPDTDAHKIINEVRETTLHFLWRQWRVIGASVSSEGQARTIVDPEALILMSLWLLKEERRLADVTVTWVRLNSRLLSIQRLRNAVSEFPKVVRHRLAWLAEMGMTDAKDARWQSLRSGPTEEFGVRKPKERAITPKLNTWATLMLQMRRGMGVGAKADVLTCVLGTSAGNTGWGSVAGIAGTVAYSTLSVRKAADDLSDARFIRSLETVEGERTSRRMYSVDGTAWSQLLKLSMYQPGWGYWLERFRFIIDLVTWLDEMAARSATAYALDAGARKLLTRHRETLWRDQVVDQTEFAGSELDLEYLNRAWQQMASFLKHRA